MARIPEDTTDDETLYTLVTWPESQKYMELEEAILITDPFVHGPSAYMVPKKYVDNPDLIQAAPRKSFKE